MGTRRSAATTRNLASSASRCSRRGRRAHVGASADLDIVADEIVQVVRVMDALNQVRFADDGELLRAWESAANVVTPKVVTSSEPGAGDVPPAGEVKPAA